LPEQLFWQETSVSPLFYMNIGETAVPGSLLKHPGTEDRKKKKIAKRKDFIVRFCLFFRRR
jgi:hypothetical protein